MKAFLFLIALCSFAWADPLPTVEVYMIRRMDLDKTETGSCGFPEVILEIANPTQQTFYVHGQSITCPDHHMEALREGKWLRIPPSMCGLGSSVYPLRPGAKILVTVDFPWEEKSMRYRFFFWNTPERDKVVSVRSRPIERKELGNFMGTIGELNSKKELEEIKADDQWGSPIPVDRVDPFAPASPDPAKKK